MEQLKTFSSGAQSSSAALRFDLIPRTILEKMARRFEDGASKYGANKYRRGLTDRDFIIDRINHLQVHLHALLAPRTVEEWEDDNIGGIAWGCAFLAEVEGHKDGSKILKEIRQSRADGLDF